MAFDGSQPEVGFAIGAVRQASLLVKQVQAELAPDALTKGDRSPVTVADFAAQALVASLLEQAFPDDPLVGEERAEALRTDEGAAVLGRVTDFVGRFLAYATAETVCTWIDRGAGAPSGRFWTLDPVDGTKGFLRGDQYAVALALIVDGRVEIGVLGCPHLTEGCRPEIGGAGSLVVAVRGQGTWTTPLDPEAAGFTRLQVSTVAAPKEARLLRSVESGHTNVGKMGDLVTALGAEAAPVLMDSQAKYAVLASGNGDLLFRLLSSKQPDYRERIWDQAAGSIVAEEAGGHISDLRGTPLDFTRGRKLEANRGVCASNGLLHEAALEALRHIQACPAS